MSMDNEQFITGIMNTIIECSMIFMKATQEAGAEKGNGWSVTLPGPGISITLKMQDFDKLKAEYEKNMNLPEV